MSILHESPDKGKTIFKIENGQRILIKEDTEKELLDQWLKWKDILRASKNNNILSEALDKAKIIYEISRKNDSH